MAIGPSSAGEFTHATGADIRPPVEANPDSLGSTSSICASG